MRLQGYLDRIGFAGAPRADLDTLARIHRGHLNSIPYETLGVTLGEPLDFDAARIFDKLVTNRRGGWCYEMNGVFGAALVEIGFKVTRMAGAAMREVMGDFTIGNHLVLLVELEDEPWIADVGFGDGSLQPFRLQAAAMTFGGYRLRLEALDERWWRFHNHEFGGARSFDFAVAPADPALLAEKCHWLQTAPDSNFVLNAVVQRFRGEQILQLRGRTLRRVTPAGVDVSLLQSADELVEVLAGEFGLDLPEAATLWARIVARHEQVMAVQAEAAQA